LNEISFTDETIGNLLVYQDPLKDLFNTLCANEPHRCLFTFYNYVNINTVSKVIMKIDDKWFKKLARIRKIGPISDVCIS